MPVLQLNPKKTALVLIDLQNSTVGVNTAPYAAVQVVANSKKLAEAFRAAGAPVIYVNVDFNGFLKLPADQPFNMGDKPIPAAASQIAPSAGFQPGDLLVTKRHWGAFAGTDLEQQLKTRGVDTVVLGFAFVLVEDACAGLDAEEHRFAFEKIFPRLARIRATDEVIAALV